MTTVFCLERGYEIIIIYYLLLEAVEVGMLERMGKKSRKLYRYVGCADEEGPTPPWEPKI